MLKILVVEDSKEWQEKLKMMLEEFGFFIVIASTLVEARQLLISEAPELIVADVRLPDGSSLDYFTIHPIELPIVFVTEFADRQYLEQLMNVSFSTFCVKPFHPFTLVAAIRTIHNAFKNIPKAGFSSRGLNISIGYGKKAAIPFSKICWIKVEGNYSTIQTVEQKFVQKRSISKLLPELDTRFIQIHKSVIINCDFIDKINQSVDVIVVHNQEFEISRSFRKELIRRIDKSKYYHF